VPPAAYLERSLYLGPGAGEMRAGNLRGFPSLVQRCGGDPWRILERQGIDPASFADPDRYIGCAAAVRALEYCRAAFGQPLFGLRLAETQSPDVFGSVAVMARAAATCREGLRCFTDYLPLTHCRESPLELVTANNRAELRWNVRGEFAMTEQANYQAMMLNLKILQMLAGPEFRPDYVTLRCAVSAKDRVLIEERIGCPVSTGAGAYAIGFPLRVLDWPVATADRLVFSLLESHFRHVAPAPADDVVQRVESFVRASLPTGTCTIARCAQNLGMNVRTLQWRLKEDGAVFSEILERQRIELAKSELRGGRASIHEIALMLGYSEQASFGRAFKRWTRLNPRAYRLQEAGGTGVRPRGR
jgi:AraC-like DNA-binding protein